MSIEENITLSQYQYIDLLKKTCLLTKYGIDKCLFYPNFMYFSNIDKKKKVYFGTYGDYR